MTPDVSSVEAVAEREVGCERWPSSCRCSACCFSYEALQQAAEQACYRYALAVLEQIAIGVSGTTWATALGKLNGWTDAVEGERDRIRQLIAGSA